MGDIGFTTGCLYKSHLSIDEIAQFYKSIGSNIIELSFAMLSEMEDFELSDNLIETLNGFDCVTVHAPWKKIKYNSSADPNYVIKKLKEISAKAPIMGIVMHPDTIDSFKFIEDSDLSVLLENMDARKEIGTKPEHFRSFKEDYGFGFVFDAQHAYENDPTMYLAKELVDAMGERLDQLHISGQNGAMNYFPVHTAMNREEITHMLEMNIRAPTILEGILLQNPAETAKKELDFVKHYQT